MLQKEKYAGIFSTTCYGGCCFDLTVNVIPGSLCNVKHVYTQIWLIVHTMCLSTWKQIKIHTQQVLHINGNWKLL